MLVMSDFLLTVTFLFQILFTSNLICLNFISFVNVSKQMQNVVMNVVPQVCIWFGKKYENCQLKPPNWFHLFFTCMLLFLFSRTCNHWSLYLLCFLYKVAYTEELCFAFVFSFKILNFWDHNDIKKTTLINSNTNNFSNLFWLIILYLQNNLPSNSNKDKFCICLLMTL